MEHANTVSAKRKGEVHWSRSDRQALAKFFSPYNDELFELLTLKQILGAKEKHAVGLKIEEEAGNHGFEIGESSQKI